MVNHLYKKKKNYIKNTPLRKKKCDNKSKQKNKPRFFAEKSKKERRKQSKINHRINETIEQIDFIDKAKYLEIERNSFYVSFINSENSSANICCDVCKQKKRYLYNAHFEINFCKKCYLNLF